MCAKGFTVKGSLNKLIKTVHEVFIVGPNYSRAETINYQEKLFSEIRYVPTEMCNTYLKKNPQKNPH